MSEEEYKECSVVVYPRNIKFLHINGGSSSYYVDRHISDYVNNLQQEIAKLNTIIEKYKMLEEIKRLEDDKLCDIRRKETEIQILNEEIRQLYEFINDIQRLSELETMRLDKLKEVK